MRYYSEEDVSKMLAKEFDEACSYSKPYSGVKMSDYPSIEIPQTNWHTGTPEEDGYYLCKSEHMIGYDIGYYAYGRFNRLHYFNQEDITEWQKIEP